jgi:hypothetical protein
MYAANNPLKFRDPSGNVFIFFDGTWNHDDPARLAEGTSFTNIVRMRDAYRSRPNSGFIYRRGIGNIVDRGNLAEGIFAGITGHGMLRIAQNALDFFILNHQDAKDIFVAGFSRGAATSLVFSQIMEKELPHKRINGMYLYDTVSSTGIPGNGVNLGVPATAASNVKRISHAISYQEDRTSFLVTNIHGRANRITQKAFWGVHGDVGGGYRTRQQLAFHTLWWISNQVKQQMPLFANVGNQCLACNRDSAHFPHPSLTYIAQGGRSLGELFRPASEYPMPGTLALSFFYDDIDFSDVGLNRDQANVAATIYIPMYLLITDIYANSILSGVSMIGAPFYSVASGLVAGYRLYHYASVHMSNLLYYYNRL